MMLSIKLLTVRLSFSKKKFTIKKKADNIITEIMPKNSTQLGIAALSMNTCD